MGGEGGKYKPREGYGEVGGWGGGEGVGGGNWISQPDCRHTHRIHETLEILSMAQFSDSADRVPQEGFRSSYI